MFFFILIFVLHTLINIYLFNKGWKVLHAKRKSRIVYCIAFFIVYISFSLAMLGRNHFPLDIQKPMYMLGTGWLGFMLYLTLYFSLTDLLHFINKFKNYPFRSRKISLFRHCEAERQSNPEENSGLLPASQFAMTGADKKSTFRRIQVFSGTLLVSILLSYGYYHFSHPSVTRKEIFISKSGNEYRELKAVGISDLHLGITVGKSRLKKYVEIINAQEPDIILIAGDVIDNNLYPLNKEKMWEELNQLKAPLGVYFCLGNHEYLSGIEESIAFLEKTSFHILIDESVLVDESFYIIGRNDLHGKNRKDLADLVQNLDKSRPMILLDHKPFHLEEAEENQIDFQFSGHTHYGQMFPLNLITHRVFELPYGYMKKGDTNYYVSSGLGLWGPQYRIGTKSEVVVFDIKFN
jgi:Predicted phosphohydrolases